MADTSAMVEVFLVVFAAAISKHQDRAAAAVPAKCSTSVQGAILRSQAYKTLASENMQDCYHLCRAEHRCQSINFYQKQKIFQLGSSEEVPGISCQEIKESSPAAASGRYWIMDEHFLSRSVMNAYCNMTLGVRQDCTGNPCLNGGTCNYQGGGGHTCRCSPAYEGVHCEAKVPSCYDYKNLSTADRNEQFGLPDPKSPLCDCTSSQISGWHRFTGAAGTQMPTRCVATHRCNTHAPGWLADSPPSADEGTVQRKVCFNWKGNCCRWTTKISVKNCGDFYVYDLVKTPTYHLRYCGA